MTTITEITSRDNQPTSAARYNGIRCEAVFSAPRGGKPDSIWHIGWPVAYVTELRYLTLPLAVDCGEECPWN